MRVSLITPSLNQGPFLAATIESVLSQDYPDLEYWVIDGGSADESLDILRAAGPRVQWLSEPDRGQAHALNKGLTRTTGEIVGYLNADDVLVPGAVRVATEFLATHPTFGAVQGEGLLISKDGAVVQPYDVRPCDGPMALFTECAVAQPSMFLRRDAVMDVGGFREHLRYCMDYDMWLRLAPRWPIGYLPQYLSCTRLHATAKTVAEDFALTREVIAVVGEHFGRVPDTWLRTAIRQKLRRLPWGLRGLLRLVYYPTLVAARWKVNGSVKPAELPPRYYRWRTCP